MSSNFTRTISCLLFVMVKQAKTFLWQVFAKFVHAHWQLEASYYGQTHHVVCECSFESIAKLKKIVKILKGCVGFPIQYRENYWVYFFRVIAQINQIVFNDKHQYFALINKKQTRFKSEFRWWWWKINSGSNQPISLTFHLSLLQFWVNLNLNLQTNKIGHIYFKSIKIVRIIEGFVSLCSFTFPSNEV